MVATVGGGTLFMTCMQATPFLLPLMFQLAFGMSAVQVGLFTLSTMCSQMASALGAALGALTLALLQMAHGRTALAAMDFRVAFGVMAALGLIGVAGFGRLKPGDGAEVSAHTTRDRPYNWLIALFLIE